MLPKSLLASAIIMALVGCQPSTVDTPQSPGPKVTQQAQSNAAHQLIEQHTLAFMALQPALSTMLDVPPEQVGGPYNHRLPDYSPSGMQALQKLMRNSLKELEKVGKGDLDDAGQQHLAIVKVIEEYFAGHEKFQAGYIDTWAGHLPYIINQISGPLIDIPKLMQVQQSVTTEQEANDYLERLRALEGMTYQVIDKFKADVAQGVVLPANLIPGTLTYFDNFLSPPPAEHPLVTTFAERLNNISELGGKKRKNLTRQATELLEQKIYPAYTKARKTVEQVPNAREADGIWSQPKGDQFYRHAIQYLGDTDLDADAIHQVGLDEVARISAEMDSILDANGYTEGSVGERMVALAKEERFLYEDSDEGRAKLLDDLNIEIDKIMAKAPELYATMPTQAVEVRRIPPVSEKGEAGGFYTPPSLDGSRPGIYWINLRDMAAVPSFGLKTLTYHEAVPGHHFQIALNMAQEDIGLLRQNAPFNAFAEGWALYSELTAKEMGMYVDDPFGDLGRLQAELYRAVRLVVDTGLHHKRWTRGQAIEYFHTTTGTSMTDVVAEVERYMAWPGQALGYKLGMLKLVELRDMAKEELGDKFDIRAFHDLILLPGARPMSLVAEEVKDWVKQQKG
ncbi:DUF885 domain-containing protein [Aliiglaciecola sp. CAU 1673]|uniref:DUF885 domain-containing protein n=1 Tax=Aliiglaciecola sp. CAU 1673 TaxID=3032595 RepID=UPI0023DBB235|nr:DUF885 domain-containing protein [Aliiglaciecola sp. CAU 1673]MDF2177336.1 DUF885 domain-containing protein [Aliiglaciecola sp. CAU 1673]